MNVSYLAPLQRSWERTKRLLFAPFRIETWLVVGFAAFLSEWLSGGVGSPALTYNFHGADVPGDIARAREILGDPFWVSVLLWSLLAAFVLGILFQWLSARGKFVFLDDVVCSRPAIREPWSRYGRLGDSLFLFRLAFLFVVAALFVLVLGSAAVHFYRAVMADETSPHQLLAPIVGSLVLAGLLGLLVAFVSLMLDSFVVPIMYRHQIGVLTAWGRFLGLFGQHPLAFVAYAVFVFLLCVGVGVAVAFVSLITCCVGLVLIVLPYVGSVVLLPLLTLFRGFGPEFLAQFGPDHDAFAGARPAAPTPTIAPVPPHVPPPPPEAPAP